MGLFSVSADQERGRAHAGPSSEAGVYHFKTILPMAGNWQLSLSAKVQGETGTLESKLPVKVVP